MPIHGDPVRDLIVQTFGSHARDTLDYRAGRPMSAARRTEVETNTLERTITTIIGQTMGRRAAAMHRVAAVLTIPVHRLSDGKYHANTWEDPTPGKPYSGSARQLPRWTKAERDLIAKPIW